MSDTSWWQAALGVGEGGLGMRSAREVALPAFIGSRVSARPMVEAMCQHAEGAGLGPVQLLMGIYDARTEAAIQSLQNRWPDGASDDLRSEVDAASREAAASWRSMCGGRSAGIDAFANASVQRQAGSVAAGLVLDAGMEDDEHPNAGGSPRGPKLQRRLCQLQDALTAEGLERHFEQAGAISDKIRLHDLRLAEGTHSWLWRLSREQGATIDDEQEYVEAVRVRLGTGGPPDGGLCGSCGAAFLDSSGRHAAGCCLGEATRGHHAVRDVLFEASFIADPSTEREPEGLVPSHPALRPADVLSPAARAGCLAALDVGVTSPLAATAGEDAAESMFERKLAERRPIEAELETQGIRYLPVVWTTFGRAHPEAQAVLQYLAKRTARRRGGDTASSVLRRLLSDIGVVLARRSARMSLACWPRVAAEDKDSGSTAEEGGSDDHWALAPGAE
jgi:hypothetical protein